jgi:hypothetical protein
MDESNRKLVACDICGGDGAKLAPGAWYLATGGRDETPTFMCAECDQLRLFQRYRDDRENLRRELAAACGPRYLHRISKRGVDLLKASEMARDKRAFGRYNAAFFMQMFEATSWERNEFAVGCTTLLDAIAILRGEGRVSLNRNLEVSIPRGESAVSLAPDIRFVKRTADDGATGECSVCHKETRALMKCTKCRTVVYCGRECQRADWGEHESACAQFCALRDHARATVANVEASQ